jgi:hypothetical protein
MNTKLTITSCEASLNDTGCPFSSRGHCMVDGHDTCYSVSPDAGCPLRSGKVIVGMSGISLKTRISRICSLFTGGVVEKKIGVFDSVNKGCPRAE